MTKKNTLPVFIFLSLVASAINYLSYPVLARLLPTDQYINITVALSILTQIGTFMAALTAVVIGLSKDTSNSKITQKIQISLLQIFTLIGLIFLITSPVTMRLINTPVVYAVPIVIMILVSIPVTIISGYLNGRQYMSRLGLVAFSTAFFQFLAGTISAHFYHNGLISMTCMGLAQVFAIIFLFLVFRDAEMPRVGSNIFKLEKYSRHTKKILTYTVGAAFCIMVLNLLQIADLLVIKDLGGAISKFYTDIYVISRVVFFAGMIFIWPFLGEISLTDGKVSNNAFMKLIIIFSLLGAATIIVLFFFGQTIINILFGADYSIETLRPIIVLSVLYKVFFLVITACGLFFIVNHSKICFYFTVITFITLISTLKFVDAGNIYSILSGLTVAGGLATFIGVYLLITYNKKLHPGRP